MVSKKALKNYNEGIYRNVGKDPSRRRVFRIAACRAAESDIIIQEWVVDALETKLDKADRSQRPEKRQEN